MRGLGWDRNRDTHAYFFLARSVLIVVRLLQVKDDTVGESSPMIESVTVVNTLLIRFIVTLRFFTIHLPSSWSRLYDIIMRDRIV